jgi:hypothetical protein
MSESQLRRTVAALAAAIALAAAAWAEVGPTRHDADTMRQKVAAILQFGARPARQPRRTLLTETELNAYLAFDSRQDLPAGVVQPSLTIPGSGRVSARAVVDLDAVRREKKPTSLLDPTSYLTGRLPVTATGTLTTRNGTGRFALESAGVAGLPIPKIVLQEIVSYYSRTPQNPAGLNIDDPFALPARIREIQVERGQAVVVQ